MDPRIALALAAGHGIVRYATLADRGYDVNAVRELVTTGVLVRLHHGVYAAAAPFRSASPVGRHMLVIRAVATGLPNHAVSHQSALTWWGMPVLEGDLDVAHFSAIDSGRARHTRRAWLHPAVRACDVMERDGLRVVAPALAVVQTTATVGSRAGLIAADAGLRSGLLTRDDLGIAATLLSRPRDAARVVELASPRAESPGESWSRLVFAQLGLAAPREQVDILGLGEVFVARVDFLFEPERIVVEFDGATKYAGLDGREQLMKEKRREDALRALGYRVVRLTWADLQQPARVAALLSAAGLSVAA